MAEPETIGTWDYIVVGAGSAGCALANRLSADPRNRVLLLEAGGRDSNPWIHIPVGYYRTMFDPDVSWGFKTEPDPTIANRSIMWPRGRVLGGSSAINGLVYVRGQREDYDLWRQLGNQGWSWDDVLPYFKRAESWEDGESEIRGGGGPLAVSHIRDRRPVCEAYIAAAKEAGIPENPDYNGPDQEGVAYFQTTSRNGRRSSAAVAYLNPIRHRHNLRIETRAHATRVEVEDGRAVAVEYLHDGLPRRAEASGEIVLSLGAINSPALLEYSGIGQAQRLKDLGIDVVHDLPGVGEDLQDHFQVRAVYELKYLHSLNTDVRNPFRQMMMGIEYALRRTGPLTISAAQVAVFAKTRPEVATPDVEFHFIPFSAIGPGQGLHPFPGVTASVCILRPESRGWIHIKSPDPRDQPAIMPNYLESRTDQRTIVDGMKLARTIASQPSFAKHVKMEHEPGDARTSDDDLLAFARERGTTIFHPSSTCRMGPDDKAVVDARLRVHGIAGLRVADSSIMPTVISGNTNAPAIMIGEKAADMMLEDARA